MGRGVGAAQHPHTTQRVDDERGWCRWHASPWRCRRVYFLVSLILQRVNADQLRSAGHQFRIDWHDAQNGITPPPYHAPSNAFTPIGLLVGAITVAAVVVACIWQHRAASAGRALGIPSRHSPAWGVGSWFVPIVNLWMPYGAVRDCLPPGAPAAAPRPALVDRLAPRRFPEHRGRCLRPVLDGSRPGRVRSRRPGVPGRHRLGARHRAGDRRHPTRRAVTPGNGRNRGVARLTRPRLTPSQRAQITRTHELFTSGLRSCCSAFTSPRYVPGSGRRRDHPSKSQSRYDRRAVRCRQRLCRPSIPTRPAPNASCAPST